MFGPVFLWQVLRGGSREERTTARTSSASGLAVRGDVGGPTSTAGMPRLRAAPSTPAAVTVTVAVAPKSPLDSPEAQIAIGCSLIFVFFVVVLLLSRWVRRRRPNHRTTVSILHSRAKPDFSVSLFNHDHH